MKIAATGRDRYGVAGLGMSDLTDITRGEPKGKPLSAEMLARGAVTTEDLKNAALQEGKPFDLICALPETMKQEMKEVVARDIESTIASTVFPNVVVLVLRLIGTLSLVVALVAFIVQRSLSASTQALEATTWGTLGLGAAVVLLMAIFYFKPVRQIVVIKQVSRAEPPLRERKKRDREGTSSGEDKGSRPEAKWWRKLLARLGWIQR
jgi:hypothetical protein